MPERDRYIPGVPCWVDTSHPDPAAAARFYQGLFGWEVEEVTPPGSEGQYFMARIRGGDVAGIGSLPPVAPPQATWNSYVWVEDAEETLAKVRAAGGRVVTGPFQVGDAGTMAGFCDPEGALLYVWQPARHRGARIVNEHGSLNFNSLATRDPDGARAFYGAVFGWGTLPMGADAEAWTLPGYGDHLELDRPTLREEVQALGGPAGFEDVVAALNPIPADHAAVPAHWGVTFAVDDADEVAARAYELGGRVIAAPFDAPWVRMTIIEDPQGATLTASRFVPENRDPVGAASDPARAA